MVRFGLGLSTLLLLLASAGLAEGTGQAAAVSAAVPEPSWMEPVRLLVGAVFTALAGWASVLMCKLISKVAERAGRRLTVEQEQHLQDFLDLAVRGAEEASAAKGLRGTGATKFAEVLKAAQTKFPALDDDLIRRGVNAAVNRVKGIGRTGNE